MKVLMICGLGIWFVAGIAHSQVTVPNEPVSNLQDGISPFAAAARAQQDQRQAAAIQQQHQADDRLYAVKARIAAHDCEGARTLALQGNDVLMAQQAEALCEPSMPEAARASASSAPSTMELGPVVDPDTPVIPSHNRPATKGIRQRFKTTSRKRKHLPPPPKAAPTAKQ